jgi:triacylglycerol lipase
MLYGHSSDALHALLAHPVLFARLRRPRFPGPSSSATVSCTGPVTRARGSARRTCVGLYGFDVRGPAAFPKMQVHWWKNVLEILRKCSSRPSRRACLVLRSLLPR